MFQSELQGLEYDWLAIDSLGHVGWFCTAGGGLAPTDLVARTEQHRVAIQSIANLPVTTTVVGRHREDEWAAAAVRGVFVFDSSYHRDPYQRVAAPVVPAVLAELPDSLAIARRLHIRGDFRELATIPTALIDELG